MKLDMIEFKKEIIKCVELCEAELNNRLNGIEGESSIDQIENMILPELNQLIIKIDRGQLPPLSERYLLSFANAFKVWGWNMQYPTKLFSQLLKLNDIYKNYKV